MSVLLVHSHYGPVPAAFRPAIKSGRVRSLRERELTPEDFETASGIITTMHLDQLGFMAHGEALQALLARGGRWFFNGHILRRFVPGLDFYQTILQPKRKDYVLTRLADHPIFADIAQGSLEENNGVAGFYGRGHNPMPPGGVAVNGIGPDRLPIDWEWVRPEGGRIFSHAGNDLGGMGGVNGHGPLLTERMIAWCAGEIGR